MATLEPVEFNPFKKSATPDDFAARYGAAADKAAKALGVDPKVVLGQWGLETGWGKSVIPGTNNLGNIKDFSGSGTAATDNMTGSRDKYRAYESPDQFVDDYVSLIQRKYPNAVNAKTPEDFAKALKSGGYAEDPGYVAKVKTAAKMTPVKATAEPTLEPVDFNPFASKQATASNGAEGSWDEAEPKSLGKRALDKASAVASGFNRGYVSRAGLPFNPVDAMANVVDLGKAAVGAPYTAITGDTPDILQIRPRGEIVGSGEWIVNQARKAKLGRMALDAPNPDDQGGFAQVMGAGAGGGVGAGASGKQEAINALMGAASAGSSKAVGDLTGNNELAIAAGMLPQAAAMAANAGAQRAVRGGEKGRREMAQRIQDLKESGIENPSLGLASGNRMIQGTENILASTPGAAGIMDRSRQALQAGITSKVDEAASAAAPNIGVREAGTAVQSGLKSFQQDWKTKQNALWNDGLGRVIPSQHPANVERTTNALSDLNAGIPNAPALSQWFTNSKIKALEAALNSDVSQKRAYTPSQLRAALEKNPQTAAELSALLDEGKLPFQAVKQFRTLVGNEISDSNMLSEISRSKWNPLYGALSQDIRDTASAVGPEATNAFNRANNYTRAGAQRLEKVAPFADAATPEKAYAALVSAAKENTSTLQAVKKSLPEDARGTLAGTIIERLGKATPGRQNEEGTAWSPDTFLTNWNKLSPASQKELFSGFKNSEQVAEQVAAVAKASAMLRDSAKIWANPSGTAPALSARTTIGGLALGVATGNWPVAAAAGAGIAGANLLARGVTNKGIVDYMARKSTQQNLLDPRNRSIPQQIVNMPDDLAKYRKRE